MPDREKTRAGAGAVGVTIDGRACRVPEGATVAAALTLVEGVRGTRTSVGGEPRTMLCGMGICHECRVSVDGRAHVLACQTPCREGMTIETTWNPPS
ncbi:(2Fe-2S)-binding protein [Burkholderia plantarii]|uniref:(2Fe-2S)-binding protein n=1 Tax=Burkholderia plantarii TaxID=41899 RepID=UPI0018DD0564|nr:(2Fe-2S)-binding protein [Burkholderia plantarii]MBI0330461.1 (2Fe-2S)-binding protein [Burkholderia plantarii]